MHNEGRDYTVNVFLVHIWTFAKQVSTLLIKPLNAVSIYTQYSRALNPASVQTSVH